jgi:3-oxoacyl-[acyl-carrier-protein] synthase III
MRIASICHDIPSRRITTDWIVDKLAASNPHFSMSDRDQLVRVARAFLERAGSGTKYQVNDGENALDSALRCCAKALEVARIDRRDVGIVIFAGVGRAWLEPATATVIQAELGLHDATSFDVLDGCAGWLRALQIANGLFAVNAGKVALIVNCECGFEDFGRWHFDTLEEVEDHLATFTIGEASTATVLVDDPSVGDEYFSFRTFGEHATLCMIPLGNERQFLPEGTLSRRPPMKFFARSHELLATIRCLSVEHELSTGAVIIRIEVFLISPALPRTGPQ